MDLREQTIRTYRERAKELAAYFNTFDAGPFIDMAFLLAPRGPQRVVEVGCGNGNDAAKIIPRCEAYEGFDVSDAMVDLARTRNPGARFTIADFRDYEFPEDLTLIYASASLLHASPAEIQSLLARSHACLRDDGIWFISVKEGEGAAVREDEHGARLFYLYEVRDFSLLGGGNYTIVYTHHAMVRSTRWLTVALRKA